MVKALDSRYEAGRRGGAWRKVKPVQTFDLDPIDVRQVLLNGFKSAFVPYAEKGDLLRRAVLEIDQGLSTSESDSLESERDLL